MKAIYLAFLACLLTVFPDLPHAQSEDLAAERARLGNQRIQTEVERRVREEQNLKEQAEAEARVRAEAELAAARERVAEKLALGAKAGSTPEAETVSIDSAEIINYKQSCTDSVDLSRELEQLRTLGELRDAGYLTEEEFQRVKTRILDSRP